jgi:hypothetical protein
MAAGFTCQEASFMRFPLSAVLLLLFALAARAADIGPFQITSGNYSSATEGGGVSGNGFTANIVGGPELLAVPNIPFFSPGTVPLDMSMTGFLPGPDAGVGALINIAGLSDPALTGLVPAFEGGFAVENGNLTVSPINVTGPGTYSSTFTLFVSVAYGPPNTNPDFAPTITQHVDFTGSGTVTLVAIADPNPNPFGLLQTESLNYSFTPVPLPSSVWLFASALLIGGVLARRKIRA